MNEIEALKEEISSLEERVKDLERINFRVENYLSKLEKRLAKSFWSTDLDIRILEGKMESN